MLLANTIHAFPVLLMGGWLGVGLSMVVEFCSLRGYLGRERSTLWILGRFLLANVLSAAVGLLIIMELYFPPSGSAGANLSSLVGGTLIAFLVTLVVECTTFLPKSGEGGIRLLRAVVMSNFFSYATIVAVYLWQLW
jgi:hypothetical protein